MTKIYVSFYLAKLLKENGFDWKCGNVFYIKDTGRMDHFLNEKEDLKRRGLNPENILPAPTYEQVYIWMMREKDIKVDAYLSDDYIWCNLWNYKITKTTYNKSSDEYENYEYRGGMFEGGYQTREEAFEDGVEYALKFIKD